MSWVDVFENEKLGEFFGINVYRFPKGAKHDELGDLPAGTVVLGEGSGGIDAFVMTPAWVAEQTLFRRNLPENELDDFFKLVENLPLIRPWSVLYWSGMDWYYVVTNAIKDGFDPDENGVVEDWIQNTLMDRFFPLTNEDALSILRHERERLGKDNLVMVAKENGNA